MCDFAHDPEEVRKLLVGRVLTVERVRQLLHVDTVDGMSVFLRALLAFGIKKEDVRTMLVDNPAKLMWMD
jgi:hypothetical protein